MTYEDLDDYVDFHPTYQSPYLEVCQIFMGPIKIGVERITFHFRGKPTHCANFLAEVRHQYLRPDLGQPFGSKPVGDTPMAVSPDEDEDGRGYMLPGWSNLERFLASFRRYPFTPQEQPKPRCTNTTPNTTNGCDVILQPHRSNPKAADRSGLASSTGKTGVSPKSSTPYAKTPITICAGAPAHAAPG